MKSTIYITREVDGQLQAIPCDDYRELDKSLVKRLIWAEYYEADLLEGIKKADNPSTRAGLEIALELLHEQREMLPAMFITKEELEQINNSNK